MRVTPEHVTAQPVTCLSCVRLGEQPLCTPSILIMHNRD
jgi:hypothetical protein